MRRAMPPRHLRRDDLELLDIKVTRDGGTVRYLEGGRYGLVTSVYRAEVPPDSGPEPHVHPYAEFFLIHAGRGRFFVGDAVMDAEAGDVVIVPPDVRHHFLNSGSETLVHTAVHEGPAAIVESPERRDAGRPTT